LILTEEVPMHKYSLPQESKTYQSARERLLEAEMALRDQRERVAQMRRELPAGPAVPDYVFREGPLDLARNDPREFFDTGLSGLFAPGKDSLIVYHFMFGPDWEKGCPMCSMWIDGYNAVAPHVTQRTNLALSARADLAKVRAYAHGRGWRNLRILSSGGNTFTADFGMEVDGDQLPGVSVFHKEPDSTVRHFYTGGAIMAEGQYRGLDLLSPVWNMYDLLPEGRGDWMPKHEY
jgi:predicted dithiol-disulfide oxidoreductase (DUF899 family)